MPERFFFRLVACRIIPLTLKLGRVDDLSVDAAPTTTTGTMFERFFFGLITLSLMLLTFLLGGVDDLSINAAPTTVWLAPGIFHRFFLRRVTTMV